VRLNTTVDASTIDEIAPDVVFVATGSVAQVPQYLADKLTDIDGVDLVMIDDVLEGASVHGRNILVVGGDQIGMQAADYLSEDGRSVSVAESHGHFAEKLAANDRWYLIARTMRKGVRRFKNVHDIEMSAGRHVRLMTATGAQDLDGIDTVVFASERRSDRSLAEVAKARGIETYVIGDAADVTTEDSGTILATIAQAYDLARSI
jgi:pyruvate/2-oxoglutarate dehydrogenase complex dihydrolipoamide dehydrogenase (E3) component